MPIDSVLALTLAASLTASLADPLPGRPTVGEIMEAAPEDAWTAPPAEELLYIEVPAGRIVVRVVPEMAPAHYRQIAALSGSGYYDGLSFYRVPIGFVAQGGDETGEKAKGEASESLPAEFEAEWRRVPDFAPLGHFDGYAPAAGFVSGLPAGFDPKTDTGWLAHCQGAFAFGRENGRDTASTEFYLTLQPQRYLDRNLTVLGRAVWGFEHLASIARNAPGNFGAMADKERHTPIVSMRLASDVPEQERTPVEIMDTGSETFRQLIEARSARPSAFFYHRAGYVDLCQMPVPVRLAE